MDSDSPPIGTELLLHCMRQRRDILLALRGLTTTQRESSAASDPTVTLGILSRKSTLLDELAFIHQQLRPFHHDDPEQRYWAIPEQRQQCQLLADEGQQLLREIIDIEQATVQAITTHRDAVAAQLQNGTDSVLANNAYTAGEQLHASSLDLSNL
jgi:hypothetical protein